MTPDPATVADTVAPHDRLRVSGMPPIPRALADRTARYGGFGPVDVVAWHPRQRTLLVARRDRSTMQLHLLDGPGAASRSVTDFDDPVVQAAFEPRDGRYLVYAKDQGGDEAAQLYRHDLADGTVTPLTDARRKHGMAVWNRAGDAIAFESLPLDRHESGGAALVTLLHVLDPRSADSLRTVARLPGGGWHTWRWSHDDRALFGLQVRSVTDSAIWRIDVATGERSRMLPSPAADAPTVRSTSYAELAVTRDGRRLVFTSDEGGEFRRLTTMDLATGERRCLTPDVPWDVVSLTMQGWAAEATGGERVAVVVDVAGRHTLQVFDVDTGERIALPGLPAAARAGGVTRVRFAQAGARDEIAFTVASARSPGDVYTLRLGATAEAEQWTRATVEGLDASAWREAEIVTWPSFDGLEVSGLLTRPPASFAGRRPVLIHIHGGPESQATIGFLGVNNYFVDELGIAYLQPNVRGSTGYGRTFVSLDDGLRREDAVRDIGALLDWIATQPDLDASRVLVAGRSYGGFMSLAVAAAYAERIVASIAIVGISHFTTFLERTETYRRDLRRIEYGDERDPAIRAFFDRISPLANADRIRKPLFVVAGRNDPRVPYEEGERMVAKVRDNGIPVWHLVADDEGHVFTRKANTDFVFQAQALFVQRHLVDRDVPPRREPVRP